MVPDLNKLAHFVAVAEELNFTRAAERLHMSQQALSTSIRQLEQELGVTLLRRTTRQVELTDAGQSLLESGPPLLCASQAAWDRAKRVGRGEIATVRVGHTPAVTGEEAAELLHPLREQHPDVHIAVEQCWPGDLATRLRSGALQLGLGRVLGGDEGISVRTIATHRLRVAVAAEHWLTRRTEVELIELEDETLIVWSRGSGYTQLLIDVCRRAGFEPRFEVNPIQGTPPITAVTQPGQFAFVTAPAGPAAEGRVVVLDFTPAAEVPVQAAWLRASARSIVAEFVSADGYAMGR